MSRTSEEIIATGEEYLDGNEEIVTSTNVNEEEPDDDSDDDDIGEDDDVDIEDVEGENRNAGESSGVIAQLIDIREPLIKLRRKLEQRLDMDLAGFDFWLQVRKKKKD